MSKQSVVRPVCCYAWDSVYPVFADERVKWHLLKGIEKLQNLEGWVIYGFCLTDESAYFITEAEDPETVQRRLLATMRQVLQEQVHFVFPGATAEQGGFGVCRRQVLDSLPQIAQKCRQIHRIPLGKGYVTNLNDYWWSSYNTYVGTYEWPFVNSRFLLLHFSEDYERAVCRFRFFHRLKNRADTKNNA